MALSGVEKCGLCGTLRPSGEPCPTCLSMAAMKPISRADAAAELAAAASAAPAPASAPHAVDSSMKTGIATPQPVSSEMKTALATPSPANRPPQAPLDATHLAQGTLVAHRYEVGAQLGQGGMGAVYKGRDRVLDEEVALKVLLPGIVGAPGMAERFLLEAKTALKLTHPGIVRVRSFEVDRDQGLSYIVMELVRGRSLRSLLSERKRLDWREAVGVVREVLEALAVAHVVTVHRDLKPENIMLDATSGRAVILDFGLAKSTAGGAKGNLTEAGTVMGTYAYMAPEQRTDSAAVDGRADLFAMGAILYECWTGMIPAGSFPMPRKLRPELPEAADEVIRRSMALEPGERYANARAMIAALGALLAEPGAAGGTSLSDLPTQVAKKGEGAPPPPVPAPAPTPAPPAPRIGAPQLAVGAMMVVTLLAVGWIAIKGRDTSGPPPVAATSTSTSTSTSAAPAAVAPAVKLPDRYAPEGPPPALPAAAGTWKERFAAAAEPAWLRLLAEKRPFKAFPASALIEAWPAIKGQLVLVEGMHQDVDFTDKNGIEHTIKETPEGTIFARWDMPLLSKETWFRVEVKRYHVDQRVRQDLVGDLVDVIKRRRKTNDEEEVLECPVIRVRWKHVHGIAAYVPPPGGEGVVAAGEDAYLAELARGFTDPKLAPDSPPEAVVDALVRAVKEGNRTLFDGLWDRASSQRVERYASRWWYEQRECHKGERDDDYGRRITIASWKTAPPRLFKNFRGEDEAEVEVSYTNRKGQEGYKTDRFDLARGPAGWRLALFDEFRPRPRTGLGPPPPDAPPGEVFAAFLRAAAEDDEELGKKLCVAAKADVAAEWMRTWQGMYRGGMVECPAEKVEVEGETARIQTAPRNKRPENSMYARRVALTREGGAWRISQGE